MQASGRCGMVPEVDSGTIRELMDLSHINASLRSRGVKGKLDIKKERLFLRGTFAAADGTRKDRRGPLGLPANPGQLLQAESRVMALMAVVEQFELLLARFPWDTESGLGFRSQTSRRHEASRPAGTASYRCMTTATRSKRRPTTCR